MIDENLHTLVDNFRNQYDSYKSPLYNETQLRREFLDKFIRALGWDVDNEQGFSETFKEVIHEASQQVGNERDGKENHTKRPDYCIQIGGRKLFYIEAKKPSVDIRENTEPSYQVRRYGWNAKMPVCLLTNFDEFTVYDTTIKPLPTDTSATARIFYCRYDELEKHNTKYPAYECNWDFLCALFSKDAVQRGSLEKYRQADKKKGTQEVDQVFLNEIEDWRVQLALNVTLRNTELNEREVNDVVQKTIDRIIFLRIAEDRGIERENTLKKIADGKDVYQNLVKLFKTADDKYNSGLFHFRNEKGNTDKPDVLTPKIVVDDKVLKNIIKSLYYPNPYEFSVMPADILGSVYERFLGKVIRLTAGHRAKVEEKPEVRKAGGVYYTPSYVVDYIVKNTIGETLTNKTAKHLGNFRIVDPACGSGSFLVGAYQFLLDWYLNEYVKSPSSNKKRLLKISDGNYKLTISERKRILTAHIFGVDIDTQAVEVTKLSLLLKALEGLSEQEIQLSLFNERALPNLSSNIKCGNSLIGNDFYSQGTLNLTEDKQYKINAFDWQEEFKEAFQDGGFDVVIGNPP
ncbi:MAG: N-6 DNA methylase, partial [Planctomycetaceae bacterium]|nr:N-6 DNA methylase [Planctomycetaceae bacterium]